MAQSTTTQNVTMKQNGTRNMGYTIECMKWSNKMDLLAYGNEKGDVTVQRLNWQKIFTHPSLGEGIKVRSLSWQMDETLLAIGYSNGRVSIVDVETEEVVSIFNYESDIHSVYFSKAISVPDYRKIYRNRTERTFDFFLPQLPVLNNVASTPRTHEEQKSFAKGAPCFLVVVQKNGRVHLLLLGALKSGTIEVTEHVNNSEEFIVYDVRLGGRFDKVYALIRDCDQLKLLQFHSDILQQYMSPMLQLAVHCANILETRNYVNDTIQCMVEAWETVLMEMDNKLTKYANAQAQGSLSADFLELLVFGYATHDIEEFLMDDLTEKGLKKLANSVDLSFSTIQNLVTKPLQAAAVNMFYFMNTIKGFGQMNYYFEPLVSLEATEQALSLCGAFLMKILELQQVIDQSVNDTKLFFCWLCEVIMRLHQQDLTEDITTETPEDTIYLAEYLNSFEDCIIMNEDGTMTKRKFNLEKIGQYFEDKALFQITKTDVHHLWGRLLDENDCLRSCPKMCPHCKQSSLIQQRNQMLKAIEDVFAHCHKKISADFKLKSSVICCKLPMQREDSSSRSFVRSSFYPSNNDLKNDTFVTTIDWQEIILLEFENAAQKITCTRLTLKPGPFTAPISPLLENLNFIDLDFYNDKILSVLVQNINDDKPQSSNEKSQCYFLQLTLELLKSKKTQHIMASNLDIHNVSVVHSLHDAVEAGNFKEIENMCTHIAVSGSRKVATILSEEQRKMTIYEMEVEEEDAEDDTENSHISPLEASKESNFI